MEKKRTEPTISEHIRGKIGPKLHGLTTGAAILGLIAAISQKIGDISKTEDNTFTQANKPINTELDEFLNLYFNKSITQFDNIKQSAKELLPFYSADLPECGKLRPIPITTNSGRHWLLKMEGIQLANRFSALCNFLPFSEMDQNSKIILIDPQANGDEITITISKNFMIMQKQAFHKTQGDRAMGIKMPDGTPITLAVVSSPACDQKKDAGTPINKCPQRYNGQQLVQKLIIINQALRRQKALAEEQISEQERKHNAEVQKALSDI